MLEKSWFSIYWFKKSTFMSYEWEMPIFLYFIALIPVLFVLRWLWFSSSKQKLPTSLSEKDLKTSPLTLLRLIPPVLTSLAIAAMLIALARPQRTNEQVDQWTEGIDIMLVLDISESMKCFDFKPNRLEAAKEVAREFIGGRFQDRIGLVIFSGEAFSKAPLTTDYDLLNTYINEIDFDQIQQGGTAIGSALAVATNRMVESDTKSKVMILLSDGDNNAGNVEPITAAKLADAYGIKIYTIAAGQNGQVPCSRDFFGKPVYQQSQFDGTALRSIAEIGKGKFYRATNNKALSEVFADIDRLEKAEIKETRFKDISDFYSKYLMWGVLFLLLSILSKSTFMSNLFAD